MIAWFTDAFEPTFMQRALLGSLLLSLSACPVGVFLMLRRMSLAGDAMAHAILPGAAAGFVLFGLDLLPMTLGGLIAGLIVAILAGAVSRLTLQREDASLAAFYLISLALGVLLVLPIVLQLFAGLVNQQWLLDVSRFLPDQAGSQLYTYERSADQPAPEGVVLNGWAGGGILAAWVVAIGVIALAAVKKRDV